MDNPEHMSETRQLALDKIADNDYELYALLKQRYSPRIFDDKEISEDNVQKLFEAARWAASSYNQQPWRFIYAHKGSGAYDKIVENLIEFNQKWAVNAPMLVLTVFKEKNHKGEEYFHALHDLGLAMGNLTVQAQYLDIALHHMAGVDREKAKETFDIPDGFTVATAVAVGHYGGKLEDLPEEMREKETAERTRNPQSEFAFQNEWKASDV
ncbi:MAG: nitroreductase family protein [Pricia sp.]